MSCAAWFPALDAGLAARGSSCLELVGFVFGVVNVWLTARQRLLAWPVGIVNAAVYLVVFARAGLYSDSGLQLLYLLLSVLGWVRWARGAPDRTPLRVTATPLAEARQLTGAVLVLWVLLATVTSRLPGSALPVADAALVASSLGAQVLMTRKRRETWLAWIVIDVAYVALFAVKSLPLTALLYALFTALAVWGHVAWTRDYLRHHPPTAPHASS